MPYTVNITITDQQIADLFVTAFEGGSNHWLQGVEEYKIQPRPDEGNWYEHGESFDGPFHITFRTEEGLKTVDQSRVADVLQLMADNYPYTFTDIVNDNADADTADMFLQLAVFGDVIYS